jgi:hypothetical protein
MSRIDASGRLTSQAISHVLNWQPGDRLTLTAGAGVVVARLIVARLLRSAPSGSYPMLSDGTNAVNGPAARTCPFEPSSRSRRVLRGGP